MPSDRPFAVAAVAVALLAAILRGVRSQLTTLLADTGLALADVTLVLAVASVASFVLDPLALFVAGYGWGTRAAVRTEYATFAASVLVVAFVGYALVHVVAISAVATTDPVATPMGKTALGVAALGFALRATLAVVAGGAVAEFRSNGVRSTPWSETDD